MYDIINSERVAMLAYVQGEEATMLMEEWNICSKQAIIMMLLQGLAFVECLLSQTLS